MILHHYPVRKQEAHLAVMTRVETSAGSAIEQLWARKVTHESHIICCVPAYSDVLRLDDLVEVDEDFIVTGVIEPSGRHLIRIFLSTDEPSHRVPLYTDLYKVGALVEVISDDYWAVDACSCNVLQDAVELLHRFEFSNLIRWQIVGNRPWG